MVETIAPYYTYMQIIDGKAIVNIKEKAYPLYLGEGIVIPSHATHSFSASYQFKMLSTLIKSGF